jgi:hypothetical protein
VCFLCGWTGGTLTYGRVSDWLWCVWGFVMSVGMRARGWLVLEFGGVGRMPAVLFGEGAGRMAVGLCGTVGGLTLIWGGRDNLGVDF